MAIPGSTEVTPIRTHRVPQSIETPVTFLPVPGAYVRYAYARSGDSIASQIEGQDYLCFQHNDQRLVFVVADGVGSSFCGQLAARLLGDGLLEWLWALEVGYLGGPAALSEAATAFLNRLQKQAQREVEEYEISGEMTALVRQALEAQRAYGSEAVFAACRIDHPGPQMPDGLITVFWMGDTQIHVLDEEGRDFHLGGGWESGNRWSTSRGARGQMAAWMHPLEGVGRVLAFSDGLSAHAGSLAAYPDAKLSREIHLGARLPTSDDVSLIDVTIRTPRYEGYPDPALPDPNLERPTLEPIANPTGAPIYEVRWGWPGQGNKLSYIIQEASTPALIDARIIEVPHGATSWQPPTPQPPGHYYYRVRAIRRHGGLTPWSELRQTKVAYPPPPAPILHPVQPGRAPLLEWEAEGEELEYTLERAAQPAFSDAEVVFEGRSTSWSIPTNRPGLFYFRVRAVSDGGPGPWSASQQVEITLPPPPRPHLAAPAYGYEHGAFELRWQGVPGATYYELEETPVSGEPRIIRVEDTLYEAADQPVGEYVFRVRACHDYACSEWSNEQEVSIAPQPPAEAPELTLTGPDASGVVRLAWTEVAEAEEYIVEVSDEAGFENARVYAQTATVLELLRREPGALYARVCAANAGGDGPWSAIQQIMIAPPAPGWIEAELVDSGARIALAWGAVGGHITYRVEMRSREEAYSEIHRSEATQHTLNVPAGAETLRFRVRAEAGEAFSEWTESEALNTAPAPPAPVLEQPEITASGDIRIRWSAVPGADSYKLEVGRDQGFADVRGVESRSTGVNFHPPASGQYWLRVRAVRRQQVSEHSNVVMVQVRRPAAPRLWPLDPVAAGKPFEVTWKGVPGCTYYEFQESPDEQFAPERVRTVRIFHPEQKKQVDPKQAGRYYYRVRAVDNENQPSQWSETLVVEVQ